MFSPQLFEEMKKTVLGLLEVIIQSMRSVFSCLLPRFPSKRADVAFISQLRCKAFCSKCALVCKYVFDNLKITYPNSFCLTLLSCLFVPVSTCTTHAHTHAHTHARMCVYVCVCERERVVHARTHTHTHKYILEKKRSSTICTGSVCLNDFLFCCF